MRTRTPKYRRQRCKGRADRAFVELNGKRTFLGSWNVPESREKYDRLVAEWLASNRMLSVNDSAKSELTVAELVLRFDLYAEKEFASGELGNYRVAVRPLLKLYATTAASAFGPKSLKAMREWMIEQKLCRTYINRQIKRVVRVFRWGAAEELVDPTVYKRLEAVDHLRKHRTGARESEPVVPLTQEQVEAVRPHLSRQVAALMDLQLLTGARSGELLKLRPIDITMSDKDLWTHAPAHHKTAHHGHQRIIYFNWEAQPVVEPFITGRPVDAYLFSPREAEQERHAKAETHRRENQKPNHRKTIRQVGGYYTRAGYYRAIVRACDKAFPHPELSQLKKLTAEQRQELREWKRRHRWHPHQLRHTAATRWREIYGIDVAQTLLGHRKGSKMTEVYAKPSVDAAKAALRLKQVG